MIALSIEITNQPAQLIDKGGRLDLRVARSVEIQPLCFAVVPHDAFIQISDGCTAVLLPASAIFQDKGLLVGAKVIEDGSITTHVFNMTSQRVRVKQGDIISVLVAL